MRCSLLLAACASLPFAALCAQIPFLSELQDPALPKAEVTVSLSKEGDSFETLVKHPSVPAHTLRFTEPPKDLCERSSARSWSGYLDVDVDALHRHQDGSDLASAGGKHPNATIEHFYFWAFESRSGRPHEDPTSLWLNGGPGCSSFTGLLMELGPCNAAPFNTSKGPHTEWNPWSWNNNATILFLDQPVGVGFSYASWANTTRKDDAPGRIYDAAAAARDASAFLQLWGMHAKSIYSKDGEESKGISTFHIAGESYAGRWIPYIAEQLLRDNEEAKEHPERGIEPLPLASVLIGNGITSPKHQFPAYVDYACSNKSGYGIFYPKEQCDDLWAAVPVCLALVDKCNKPTHTGRYDEKACAAATLYCEDSLQQPWADTGRSTYDWAHWGDYEQEEWVAQFLNAANTKKGLGIDKRGAGDHHDGVFVGCSDKVYENFDSTADGPKESTWAVKRLLENGVRVLAYSGKRDFICNHIGNEAWTLDLEWSGKEEFNKQELKPWIGHDGQQAGSYRNYGNFTFAIVEGSGHFVPLDQPQNALIMLNRWLHEPADGTF
ncbi:alpha/beta-hydrolase [Ceraceosorus guamensis]|uniref:Carboxypeptidase n=1 Tax=Ceraceosorus guamensis TaxID=1522189 RepID=A0A316W0P1_9BASI|nr:alpha/beta-hydrolase [Ceraceosorus guamensis]PWN43360.1 alpha/beta-hydrolase [Ceraceosorus guamensis]